MRSTAVAFACGALFAVGLAVAGMTSPARVIGFLDVTGPWDPALALVMGGALAVLLAANRVRLARPLLAPAFGPPPPAGLDARLVTGAGLFGVGWGLSGFCPGPALASLGTGRLHVLGFVLAMLAGTLAVSLLDRRTRVPVAVAPSCG